MSRVPSGGDRGESEGAARAVDGIYENAMPLVPAHPTASHTTSRAVLIRLIVISPMTQLLVPPRKVDALSDQRRRGATS